MKKVMPWVRWFASDWLAGSRGLSPHETAIYITVLNLIYEKNGAIGVEPDWLARYCSMTRPQAAKALESLVEKRKLYRLSDGNFMNERCATEIKQRANYGKVQRENAKKSVARRARKASEINTDDQQSLKFGSAEGQPTTPTPTESSIEDYSVPDGTVSIKAAVAAYSTLAARIGLPRILAISKQRREKLKSILKQHGIDTWKVAMSRAADSAFLAGDNDRGWKPNLDFFLQPSSFVKLIEGQYDNRPKRPNGTGPPKAGAAASHDEGDEFDRALERRMTEERKKLAG